MRLLSWTFIPIAKPFARFKFHSFVRETRLRSPQRKTGFQRRRLMVLLAVYEFKQRNTWFFRNSLKYFDCGFTGAVLDCASQKFHSYAHLCSTNEAFVWLVVVYFTFKSFNANVITTNVSDMQDMQFFKLDSSSFTYDSARAHCVQNGGDLCSAAQICPDGTPVIVGVLPGDQWAPIRCDLSLHLSQYRLL